MVNFMIIVVVFEGPVSLLDRDNFVSNPFFYIMFADKETEKNMS